MTAIELSPTVIRGGGRPDTYKNVNGKRVVSVTTITGRYDNKESLIVWAARETREGRDYNITRDHAAATGTAVHAAIEDFVCYGGLGEPTFDELETDEQKHQANLAFRSFVEWYGSACPIITHAETPLVNERLQVAGTVDAVGYLNGKRTLLDWKTSNGIYPGHIVQVAAYGTLWSEAFTADYIEQYAVLRFGKDGTRHEHAWTAEEMAKPAALFEKWLESYRLDSEVQKLLRKRTKSETKEGNHVQES